MLRRLLILFERAHRGGVAWGGVEHTHVMGTYLDRGTAVKAKRLCLPVLQVDLQDIWHEQKRVVLHRVLQKEPRDQRFQRSSETDEVWYVKKEFIKCLICLAFTELSVLMM